MFPRTALLSLFAFASRSAPSIPRSPRLYSIQRQMPQMLSCLRQEHHRLQAANGALSAHSKMGRPRQGGPSQWEERPREQYPSEDSSLCPSRSTPTTPLSHPPFNTSQLPVTLA